MNVLSCPEGRATSHASPQIYDDRATAVVVAVVCCGIHNYRCSSSHGLTLTIDYFFP